MSCQEWCQEDLGDYPLPPPPLPPHLEDEDLHVLMRGCQCGEEEDWSVVTRTVYIVIISILGVILLLIICMLIVCCVNNR